MSKISIEMNSDQLEIIKKAMEHYINTVQLEGDVEEEAEMIVGMSEDILDNPETDTTYLWNC
jgi:hypothetical protein